MTSCVRLLKHFFKKISSSCVSFNHKGFDAPLVMGRFFSFVFFFGGIRIGH